MLWTNDNLRDVGAILFVRSDVARDVRSTPVGDRRFKVDLQCCRSAVWPLNPGNPQQQSNTGQTRDGRQEESQCMSVSFVRSCSRSSCCACRQHRSRKSGWGSSLTSPRRRCLSMSSPFVRAKDIFGLRATGPMAMTLTIIIGCRARGCWLRKSVSSGLQPIGVGAARGLFSMKGIGVRWSVSMAGVGFAFAFFVVGLYGGISYGFGYFGEGYEGGRWDHDRFFYNRSVNNINVTEIHNVYNTTIINRNENHVSYNGGNGGINRRPTPQEEAAARERHIPPAQVQTQHAQAARTNPQQRVSMNMGKPPVAATPRPGVFNHPAVVPAKAARGPYTPPANRGANRAGNQPRPENNNRPSNNAGNNNV